jgi:hypothetical protein
MRFVINQSGLDFIEMKTKDIKYVVPVVIAILFFLLFACYIKIGFNYIGLLVSIFPLFVLLYGGIYTQYFKRISLFSKIIAEIEFKNEYINIKTAKFNKLDAIEIERNDFKILLNVQNNELNRYSKFNQIVTLNIDSKKYYLILDFFDKKQLIDSELRGNVV